MFRRNSLCVQMIVATLTMICMIAVGAQTFRVATYNVENYLDKPTESRHFVKSAAAKAKIRESIRAMNPDVIALEEMGAPSALQELRNSLKADGEAYSYWEFVTGWDTNIHVTVLSKFPIIARHPHTNENFLLNGRRFSISRGFADVDIQVNSNYTFTLMAAHLKSKRPVPYADEAEERLEEAKMLREEINKHFEANPNANLVVVGDFNDTKDSAPIRELTGRGRFKLLDTRPAERNGDNAPSENPRYDPRNITWTHFYGKEDTYSRIDYIMLSPGIAPEWVSNETYVVTIPNWGVGSDHRPIVATFTATN